MRRKHRNDQNHGKNGFICRNVRYKRSKAGKKMGKARMSACWK
jgi:hypothetical protein